MSLNLTVVVLTFNEGVHLARMLRSVKSICSQIVVVDSGSNDDTVAIAAQFGAVVLYHPFENQAKQFQWAMDNAGVCTEWVMRLDADEIVESDLVREITERLPVLSEDIVGINLRRKHIFMDRWVRYGGRYPLIMLRIWRNGYGKIEDRWMDEHIVVDGGRIVTFNGGFVDHNLHDLTFFTDKHNKYATREAIEVLNQRLKLFGKNTIVSAQSVSFQTYLKRWVKEHVFNNIPFTIGAALYFLWRYIFQLGFLDGRSGLVYHFLQGFWYRFLVGAKVMELERAVAHLTDRVEICSELSRLTGHKLHCDIPNREPNSFPIL